MRPAMPNVNAPCDEGRALLMTRPEIPLHDLDSILSDNDKKDDVVSRVC